MRLLCDSNPMCYGSSASMLSILDHLNAEITALVQGVTSELLARDPAVDHVIETNLKDPIAVEHDVNLSAYDAVLVVSNQSNIACYHAAKLPIFFVDILYFYGHHKTGPVWSWATQTFVQRFPGVRRRLMRGDTPGAPIEIGPLIRTADALPTTAQARQGTLIQLGGARSCWIRPGVNTPYPALIARWLKELQDALPKPITVAVGRDAAEALRPIAPANVAVKSFPQTQFLAELNACELYLTTPGLGAVFEGAQYAQDMVLLPPQNATQVVQLTAYEREGLTAPGLNLMALDPHFPKHDPYALSEADLTQEVLNSLHRLFDDAPASTQIVVERLRTALDNLTAHRAAQERFMSTLGTPGGHTVATTINEFWRAQCR